jgi:protease I
MSKIAMPLGADFEDSEYAVPFQRLQHAGHTVVRIGAKKGETVKGKRGQEQATIEATAPTQSRPRILRHW